MRQLSLSQLALKKSWDICWISPSVDVQRLAHQNGIKHILVSSLENPYKHLDANQPIIIDIHQKDISSIHSDYMLPTAVTLISDVGYKYPVFGAHNILIGTDLDCWANQKSIISTGQKVTRHSGRKWMIFRKEFCDKGLQVEKKYKNILICHGGSDPYNLTELSLRALNLIEDDITITVLATDSYTSLATIKKLANENIHPCDLVINTTNVCKYMEKAELAVINGGNVRYELCLTGTPYIAVSIQSSQYIFTEQLSQQGIGINLGLYTSVTPKSLSTEISNLMSNVLLRTHMTKKMKSLFDLHGAERILDLFYN